ncbi:HET-domain-containing protein [Pyrenochaeta sp. DS3sAY3a]|nr:HET-domain-containing protein [Pyrenochaeta sp. DS3sAY3a]
MKTTLENVDQHLKFIDIADLPATFQDAVLITQKLGHQYLWIDSLCIIQDSPEDWWIESSRMNYIYQNAKLTIMAESAHNSHEGIFASSKAGRKEVKVHPFSIEAVSQGSKAKGRIFFRDPIPSSCQYDSGPLSNRAWVLQEELLSARILRFAPHQMYWQCQTVQFSESDPVGSSLGSHWRNGALLATIREPVNLIPMGLVNRRDWHDDWTLPRWQQWRNIVNEFMLRKITFETDRLPAISAIARQFTINFPGLEYRAGLWEEDFHAGLLWDIRYPGAKRTQRYVDPSWSWASLNVETVHQAPQFEVHLFYTQQDWNRFGAVWEGSYVQISGRCATLCRCRVPLGCFDVYTEEEVESGNVHILSDTTCIHDREGEHAELLMIHVADGTGHGLKETEVDFPFFAWCLLLQPGDMDEAGIRRFTRIGLIKLPYFGRDFAGKWALQRLNLF